jgi:hypothetical protein
VDALNTVQTNCVKKFEFSCFRRINKMVLPLTCRSVFLEILSRQVSGITVLSFSLLQLFIACFVIF